MTYDPDTGEVLCFDFAEWLGAFGNGGANRAISEKMARLNAKVQEVGAKGTITITFEVAPHSKAKDVCGVALKSLKSSEPMEPVDNELFYHAEGGGLSRVAQGPPKQPDLFPGNVTPLKGKAN